MYSEKTIRAQFDAQTITVYQAFNPQIAKNALRAQKFVPPFGMHRMTWIKPSFLWMMFRCGWARKENQEMVLAIQISREGWEWALSKAVYSHYHADMYESEAAWKAELEAHPVRLQWDPEKDIHFNNLPYRSIQIGIKDEAVHKYVHEWTVSIQDMTPLAHELEILLKQGQLNELQARLPQENIYPLDTARFPNLGMK